MAMARPSGHALRIHTEVAAPVETRPPDATTSTPLMVSQGWSHTSRSGSPSHFSPASPNTKAATAATRIAKVPATASSPRVQRLGGRSRGALIAVKSVSPGYPRRRAAAPRNRPETRPVRAVRSLARRGTRVHRDAGGDGSRHGHAVRGPVGPNRPPEGPRRARLRVQHQLSRPQGARDRGQPARRAALLLGRARKAGPSRGPGGALLGRGDRTLHPQPAPREPAQRHGLTPE